MTIKTNYGQYPTGNRDAVENFHGNQLVYLAWDEHLSVGPANVFPLPPEMPFAALLSDVIPVMAGFHPNFADIDWQKVSWILDGKSFSPQPDKSLKENGIGHKSLLRFKRSDVVGI